MVKFLPKTKQFTNSAKVTQYCTLTLQMRDMWQRESVHLIIEELKTLFIVERLIVFIIASI